MIKPMNVGANEIIEIQIASFLNLKFMQFHSVFHARP
jgi:hypothetical protein